jgi:uncharacterized protein YndB with AHSA1/START domain
MSKGEIIPERAVRFTRLLSGPVERVWEFLTDAARLPEWHGEGRIEPREGGAVTLLGGHIRGVVTIWRPMRAFGYTWNVFAPGEEFSAWPVSYLEFALAVDGGNVKLILTHRPIPEAMHNQTAMGWHTFLDLIEAGLKGQFPKRADLFTKNAALYGVDMQKIQR